ncbi:vacuolar protein sorting-associated protein 13B [Trichonephila inaurata madagascariensis]|uniref:Vacuolar protein sorting-associated protein 13B n=1 Tax=Trichonephila inaurata madagascariensis TaxID=2747483 RepID=A0A8X6X1S5_9ARAC|nr:vacuolar protein sorting-associated protein 13B [Trichonephila inaurata madagascariensis]
MFKLESYITPLLLNYVDKYIKNLKPEDSQFSLWGGDAVFCNLDLRLDVLEQELQLPFTFVNGHIHELRIHIPWTKLGSEPVIITINTIECILKLSTENEDADSDRKKKKKFAASRGLKKPDISEAPPGYVQSLINRVISNICIICNNVVLKYVEDDIVLSLNIKSVELFSANEKWEKVFLDTNLAETVSRKVIYMQDLTVCLDKRDASGKIETYQDPLLYRCSSTWRMYSVYKSPHSKYPSLTRIHMFCENLDFSLTDQQLPMFLRLLNLCIALHNGSNFTSQENKKNQEDCSETRILSSDDELDDSEVLSQDASWGSWAWSFVPDVGVLWNSSSTEEELEESNMLKSKKIFQFGIYIGKSSCVLKHTMISQDSSCCSSPKYAFSPLMIIKMYGCSMEFTLKGKDFINVQSGVCGVTVTGLEDCVCGYQDFSTSSNEKRNIFLKSGVPPGSGHAYSFLSSSLFDPLAPENCNQERKYCFNSAEHLSTLTEEVLVQRFPAFAFDYLYELEVPEDWIDKISSITSSFLEDSNWHESATCRLVFGPLCVDVTSSLIHRLQKLMVSAQDYDYPYYSLSRKTSVHSVSVDDDILTQMEEFVPVRQYHLTLFKPVLRLSVADHFPYLGSKSDSKKVKKRSSKFSKTMKSSKVFETLFSLEIYAECLDFQTSIPMYPNKLIKVIGCLSNPNQFLLHHCYNSNSMKVFGLEILLHEENSNIFPENTIVQQNCLTFFKKSLVQPEKWSSTEELTLQECTFECSNMHLKLSELEFLALISIYQSWTAKFFNLNGLEKLKIASKESQSRLPVVCAEIYGINALYMQKEDLTFMKFSMISLCLKFQNEEHSSTLFHAPESTANLHNGIDSNNTIVDNLFYEENKHMFLEILLQKPNDMSSENLALLVLNISGSTVCLEPAFFDWLSTALFTHLDLDATDITFDSCSSPLDFEDASTCSSLTQEASASYSLSKSHSTVLVSAKKVSLHQNIENFLFKHCHFLSYLVLEIEIGTLCCIIPQSTWSVKYSEGFSVLHSWQHAESNEKLVGTCVFCLPNIKIKNNNFVSNFLQKVEFTQIIDPFKISQCDKRNVNCFPWTLQVDSCSVYSVEGSGNSKYNFLLCPTTVSATLALSLKNNQNQIALCIHIDSKSVHFNMSAIQAELLVYCFNTVSVVVKFTERLKSWLSFFQLKVSDASEYLGLNAELNPIDTSINYKKASDNDHCKKTSSNEIKSMFVEDSKPNQKLTLWIQMTLSKLSVVVLGKLSSSCDHDNFKLQFDAEEIVSSYDFQEVYSKMIMKLSSLSINCFVKPSKTGLWRPAPYEGKVIFCSNMISKNLKPKTTVSTNNVGQLSHMKPDNQPFLVATYTQALHSNVKEKLSANAKQAKIAFEETKYISEIDLKIKSFGVILWMSLIDVLYQISRPFLDTFTINPIVANSIQDKECLIGLNFCAKNLPLFYIETNIIQVYLPENTTLTKDAFKENDQNVQDENEKADVLLLQLDYVILTSQVENPLPRIILDSDIYTSALNSKTISLPGAAVEDRQYQMDLCGLTLGSISGTNMAFQNEMKKDIVSHYPLTMGENPALEWNTGVIPENRSFTKDSAVVTPIISPLNIRVAIAPAIVCDAPSKESEKILVAGISSEISVTSEVCLYLNIHQTCIMYSLFKNNLDFVSDIFDGVSFYSENCAERSSTPMQCNKNSQKHNFYASSVISSDSSNVQVKLNTSNEINKHNFVPFELLITAGTVSVMLFYYENDCKGFKNDAVYIPNLKDISVAECTSSNNSVEYHTKEIKFSSDLEDKRNKYSSTQNGTLIPLHPFLCLTITQPHCYLLCRPSSQKFESSCFDLQLHGSPADFIVERPHKSCSPLNDDFTYPYLETKPGEPHEKTGIPPAFLTVTCTDIFSNQANMKISVERPVKLNFRTSMGESILTFIQCFQEKFRSLNTSVGCKFSSNSSENSSNMKILTYFTNMTICTSQVMLEFSPLLADSSEKLIISTSNMKIETDVEACKGLRLVVAICRTEERFSSAILFLMFDLFKFISEKACSQK